MPSFSGGKWFLSIKYDSWASAIMADGELLGGATWRAISRSVSRRSLSLRQDPLVPER